MVNEKGARYIGKRLGFLFAALLFVTMFFLINRFLGVWHIPIEYATALLTVIVMYMFGFTVWFLWEKRR